MTHAGIVTTRAGALVRSGIGAVIRAMVMVHAGIIHVIRHMAERAATDHLAGTLAVRALPFQAQALLAVTLEIAHLDLMRTSLEIQRYAQVHRPMQAVIVHDALAVDIKCRTVIRRQIERILPRLRDIQRPLIAGREMICRAFIPERVGREQRIE